MNLHWIKNSAIDRQKWDACIDRCDWGNVYALSWFLDLITGNQWEALVIGDYEHVMPIPFRKKFGIKYTYRPNFCQQLGVFSSDSNLSQTVLIAFISELLKSYKQAHYPLNSANLLESEIGVKFKRRTNFLLNLNEPFDSIHNKYSDGLKRTLKTSDKANLQIRYNIEPEELLALHKKAWNKVVSIPDADYFNFQKITEFAKQKGLAESLGIHKDGRLLGVCVILKYKNRIYYPFSAIAPEGRKYSAVAVLINSIIKRYSNTDSVFDFEGSDIESIKTFYQRFNPYSEYYFQIEKSIPILEKALSFLRLKKLR